jgi:dipeptidyl aminopeptidase/acylaminoacyl peptidase
MSPDEETTTLSQREELTRESEEIERLSQQYAKFYDLPPNCSWKEVTQDLLDSHDIAEKQKQHILKASRRLFVFTYPSDVLNVKGFISIVPEAEGQPALIVLRGGNRVFGIPNPAANLYNPRQYTVIAPCYRGGVSEGCDEYGGDDVNDVKHLIDYISEIEKILKKPIKQDPMYFIGCSRGGMQMLLALARFPELQNKFAKIVSLSGLLNLRVLMEKRSEMREMFVKDFGLMDNINENEWINRRDPMLAADKIRKDLPILIIQGTKDIRVSLEEGRGMVRKLQKNGSCVTYWEIKGGRHCLYNRDDRAELILDWLAPGCSKFVN